MQEGWILGTYLPIREIVERAEDVPSEHSDRKACATEARGPQQSAPYAQVSVVDLRATRWTAVH